MEKTQCYIDSRDFEQVLKCYNQIIENLPQHPHCFFKHASIHASSMYE